MRGRDISARAIASCCCSPPDSVPASWRGALAEDREPREPPVACRRGAPSRSVRAMPPIVRFSSTVSLGEHVAALGDQRDAAAHDRLGHEARERRAVEHDRAALRLQGAGERAQQGRLAGAVRARASATISPRATSSETSRIATTAP